MKHIFWFWLPPIGYMAAIFVVSSLPTPQIGGEIPDYFLHALEYFLLALLLVRLFLAKQFFQGNRGDFANWQRACLLAVIIAIAYGISDEIHQYFVPGRHCSLHDMVSDTVGALIAYGVAFLDYLLLNRYRSWIVFLKRFRTIHSISYTAYWGKKVKRDV
jgi:VanZ family protein